MPTLIYVIAGLLYLGVFVLMLVGYSRRSVWMLICALPLIAIASIFVYAANVDKDKQGISISHVSFEENESEAYIHGSIIPGPLAEAAGAKREKVTFYGSGLDWEYPEGEDVENLHLIRVLTMAWHKEKLRRAEADCICPE